MALTQVASGLIASVAGSTITGSQSIPKSTLPTGSVLQVVSSYYATTQSTTGSSFIDTGLTASITPTSSSSKVLIFVSHATPLKTGGADINYQLQRNGTNIWGFGSDMLNSSNTNANYGSTATVQYLDTPATTSAITYKTQYGNGQGTGTVYAQIAGATITLMEISA